MYEGLQHASHCAQLVIHVVSFTLKAPCEQPQGGGQLSDQEAPLLQMCQVQLVQRKSGCQFRLRVHLGTKKYSGDKKKTQILLIE